MNGYDLLMAVTRLNDRRLKATDKAVLCAIASFYNADKGCSYPSVTQIGEISCCRDRHSVIRAIKRLEEYGYLKAGRSPGRGTAYVIYTSAENNTSAEINTTKEVNTSAEINTAPVHKLTPQPVQKSTHKKQIEKQIKTNSALTPAPAREAVIPAHPVAPKFKAWGLAHRLIETGDPEVYALTGGRKESSAGQLVKLLTGSDASFQKVHPLLVKHQIGV